MASASGSEAASQRTIVGGAFFPAGSVRREPAELRIGDGGVTLHRDGETVAVDLAAAIVSDRVGSIPRQISFADGSRFETGDNDGVDALLAAAGRRRSVIHRLEALRPWLLVTCAVLCLAIFALVRWGLPAASDFVANFIPATTEATVGAYALDAFDKSGEMKPTRASQRDIARATALLDELVAAHGGDPAAFRLIFRSGRGGIGANALALPGGTIVVTDEMLARATDDDALAGVLAHEMGHVAERHPLRIFIRTLGIGAISTIAIGDAGTIGTAIATAAGVGLGMSYSREFEREADRHAAELMRRTGRDPRALGRLLLLIAPDGSDPTGGWLSSHPTSVERATNLE